MRPKQTLRQIADRLDDIGSHQTYNDLEGLARIVANRMLKGKEMARLPPRYKDWGYVVMAFARPLKKEITKLKRTIKKIKNLAS
jgi:hypothetical protein